MTVLVLLAAGAGKRMQPLTNSRSKAMLPILGKPIVERILDSFHRCGVEMCVLVVRPDDQELKAFADDYNMLAIQVAEQPHPSGTADALRAARPHIRSDFILTACDQWVPIPDLKKMLRFWENSLDIQGLLTTLEVPSELVEHVGIVQVKGGYVTQIVEKPQREDAPSRLASLPLYCFRPGILDSLDDLVASIRGEVELQQVIQKMIDTGWRVAPFPITNRQTMRHPVDLLEFNLAFMTRMGHLCRVPAETHRTPGVNLIEPIFIEQNAAVEPGCSLGPQIYVEAGAHIGRDSTLERSLVLRGSEINPQSRLSNCIVYVEGTTKVLEFEN